MTAVGAAELLFHLGLAGAFLALLGSTLELWRGAPQLDAPRARGLLPQVGKYIYMKGGSPTTTQKP